MIQLTQGKHALVDDEDFDELNKFNWCAHKAGEKFYVVRNSSRKDDPRHTIKMHSVIMQTPTGLVTDHKDGNGLNNQKSNLRNCTLSENQMNRGKGKNNTSGFKGVSKHRKKFQANIGLKGKMISLGHFDTKAEAYEAYVAACKKYHGEFANLK